MFELPCTNYTWYELLNFLLELFCTFMHDFSLRRNSGLLCLTTFSHFGSPQCKYLQLPVFQRYLLLPYKCAVIRQFWFIYVMNLHVYIGDYYVKSDSMYSSKILKNIVSLLGIKGTIAKVNLSVSYTHLTLPTICSV